MKTLDEYNEERQQHYILSMQREPGPNGIACPSCGDELWDSSPSVVLYSSPAQKHVHCQQCNYRGYRLA